MGIAHRPASHSQHPALRPAVLVPLLLALLAAPPSMASGSDSGSMVFESTPQDGHLKLSGSGDWDTLRSSPGPAEVYDDIRFIKVNTRPDIIYRGFLSFDTSPLPDDAAVTSAVLHIYAKCTGDLDDTGLYVLGGTDDYPHQPLIPEDYALSPGELSVCARVDAGGWTHELAYREVWLESPAAVVRTDGLTKLCLLERRDYENDAPPDVRSENELKLYTYEEGDGFRPYLEVSWGETAPDTAAPSPDGGAGNPLPLPALIALLAGAAALVLILMRGRSLRRRAGTRG